jgi:DNA-directed RNA polymerase subunit RPC12/RpoP
LELIAGIVVAVVAVGAVLQPLWSGAGTVEPTTASAEDVEFEVLEESASPKVQALLALKEIEFDHATGKLSDEDYADLKTKYSQMALAAIEAEEGAGGAEDAAEALVRQVAAGKLSVCPKCGPRPESDAAFCSDCGKPLTRAAKAAPARGRAFCEDCGSKLAKGAKFCPECGTKVGAVTAGSAS